MTSRGRAAPSGLLRVLLDEVDDSVDERVREPLPDRGLAPGEVELPLRRASGHRAGVLDQPFGRVRPAVEEDVLDPLEQLGLDVLVHRELARVDDAHVEPRPDRVEEERRVHRLAHGVVPAEGEGEVRDAPRDERPGQRSFRSGIASMNDFANPACSSIPVATASTFGSRTMSSGANPARSTRRSYARPRISTLRSAVSACPRSSNAMTTTPAP